VGEITYYPWQHWSLEGNFAWDFSQENVNNAGTTFTYTTDKNRSFRFSYLYAKPDQTVPLQSFGVRLVSQMISLGVAWPINRNVNALAYAYYDLSNHRPQSIFAGLEYSTCCWAVRGLVSSNLYQSNVVPTITGTRVTNQYQTVYYLQFLLKGLGDFGTSDPSTLLKSALPGYVDPFKPK
jgi:LPS-assembly protein